MAKKTADKSDKGKGTKVGDDTHWGTEPEEHDYPAAAAYLSLTNPPTEVRRLVTALKSAPILHYMAKDLLRASSLALLAPTTPTCARPGQGEGGQAPLARAAGPG